MAIYFAPGSDIPIMKYDFVFCTIFRLMPKAENVFE